LAAYDGEVRLGALTDGATGCAPVVDLVVGAVAAGEIAAVAVAAGVVAAGALAAGVETDAKDAAVVDPLTLTSLPQPAMPSNRVTAQVPRTRKICLIIWIGMRPDQRHRNRHYVKLTALTV
jgi:hypothetical protein